MQEVTGKVDSTAPTYANLTQDANSVGSPGASPPPSPNTRAKMADGTVQQLETMRHGLSEDSFFEAISVQIGVSVADLKEYCREYVAKIEEQTSDAIAQDREDLNTKITAAAEAIIRNQYRLSQWASSASAFLQSKFDCWADNQQKYLDEYQALCEIDVKKHFNWIYDALGGENYDSTIPGRPELHGVILCELFKEQGIVIHVIKRDAENTIIGNTLVTKDGYVENVGNIDAYSGRGNVIRLDLRDGQYKKAKLPLPPINIEFSSVLIGVDPKTFKPVELAEKEFTDADDNTLFGVRQEDIAAGIRIKADDPAAQEELCEEIFEAFQSHPLQRTELFNALYINYTKDGIAEEEKDRLLAAIRKHCKERSVFIKYVNAAFQGELRLGWKSALLFAKLAGITVQIFRKKADTQKLERIGSHVVENQDPDAPTFNLLSTDEGCVHYNILTPIHNQPNSGFTEISEAEASSLLPNKGKDDGQPEIHEVPYEFADGGDIPPYADTLTEPLLQEEIVETPEPAQPAAFKKTTTAKESVPEGFDADEKESHAVEEFLEAFAQTLNGAELGTASNSQKTPYTEKLLREKVKEHLQGLHKKNRVKAFVNYTHQKDVYESYCANVEFTEAEQQAKRNNGIDADTFKSHIDVEGPVLCEKLDRQIYLMEVEEREIDVKDNNGVIKKERHKVPVKHYLIDKNGRRELTEDEVKKLNLFDKNLNSIIYDKDTRKFKPLNSFLPRTLSFKVINGVVHVVMGGVLFWGLLPQALAAFVAARALLLLADKTTNPVLKAFWEFLADPKSAVVIGWGAEWGKWALLFFYAANQWFGTPSTYNKISLFFYNIVEHIGNFGYAALHPETWTAEDLKKPIGQLWFSLTTALCFGLLAIPVCAQFSKTITDNPKIFGDLLQSIAAFVQIPAVVGSFIACSALGNMFSANPILEAIKRGYDSLIKDLGDLIQGLKNWKAGVPDAEFPTRLLSGLLMSLAISTAAILGFINFPVLAYGTLYSGLFAAGIPGIVAGLYLTAGITFMIFGMGFAAGMPLGKTIAESLADRQWWRDMSKAQVAKWFGALFIALLIVLPGGFPNVDQAILTGQPLWMGVFALLASAITEFDGTRAVANIILTKVADFFIWLVEQVRKLGDKLSKTAVYEKFAELFKSCAPNAANEAAREARETQNAGALYHSTNNKNPSLFNCWGRCGGKPKKHFINIDDLSIDNETAPLVKAAAAKIGDALGSNENTSHSYTGYQSHN